MRHFFSTLLRALVSSLLIGAVCAALLKSLDLAEEWRASFPWLVYLIPVAGISSIALYKRLYPAGLLGHAEIHQRAQANKKVPWILAPLVYIGTFLSHLFGASVGREGSAVQIGGAIGSHFSTPSSSRFVPDDWIRAGFAAGFTGLFGTPIAGFIFALEVGRNHKTWLRRKTLLSPSTTLVVVFSLVSFLSSQHTGKLWGVSHLYFPEIHTETLGSSSYFFVAALAFVLFLAGTLYCKLKYLFKILLHARFNYWQSIGAASVLLVGVSSLLQNEGLLGLGLPLIQSAFTEGYDTSSLGLIGIAKLILTSICTAAGFIGGEVTPLFAAGSSIGRAFASYPFVSDHLPSLLAAALGFGGVFAIAARVPLAGCFLVLETFGWHLWPWCFCMTAASLCLQHPSQSKSSIYTI